MRRRATDFRRPVRRRVPDALWWALCCAVVLLFIYILTKGTQIETRPALSKRTYKNDRIMEGLNITEEMLSSDSVTRQLNDQISLAKAFVVIAKESNNLQFAWELSAQIRNSQILLSNAATRRSPLTTRESESAIHDMALLLYQAQQLHYDSATMIMRFKAKIQALEEQMNSVTEKISKYGQIAAEEVPKSLYCLGVRLTTEWFKNLNLQKKLKDKRQVEMKIKDKNLYHFCVFSDNIIATSVVVNSTAKNSKNPNMVVFHLVVVQKDLSDLFSIDLNGNVNGAVETCMETFHRYHKYLNYSHPLIKAHFDPDACGWAFGMNVFDLVEWRKKNVTGIYHYWQEKNVDRTLWKLGTLPPGLLTFYGLTQPLDPSWHVLGFGYTNVDPQLIERGAVLHFNGNSKPWLKIGIEKYKPLWEKHIDYSHPVLQQCNFH